MRLWWARLSRGCPNPLRVCRSARQKLGTFQEEARPTSKDGRHGHDAAKRARVGKDADKVRFWRSDAESEPAANGQHRSLEAMRSNNPEADAPYVWMCQNRRSQRAQKSAPGKGSSEHRGEPLLRFTGAGEANKPPIRCTAAAKAQQADSGSNLRSCASLRQLLRLSGRGDFNEAVRPLSP
jgi:hypothetical protein